MTKAWTPLPSAPGHGAGRAFEQIEELVLERVPVPQRRLPAGLQRFQAEPEIGQAERVAQALPFALAHAGLERLGIAAAGFGRQ